MSDTTLNQFVAQFADATARLAFTPTPPSPAASPESGYFAYQQDTGALYAWDSNTSAWVFLSDGGGGTLPATVQGDLLYATAANTLAALAKNATATRYLSNTGATNNPAWAQVVLTNGVSGVLPVANGGTGSASGSAELKATVTVTNAEWKALPTSGGKTLVAAPGSGFYIAWSRIEIRTYFTLGAYTGAAAVSYIAATAAGGGNFGIPINNDNTTTPALTQLTRLNAAASRRAIILPFQESIGATGEEYILTSTADGTTGIDDITALDNLALLLVASSGGVDFGGGNAGNSAKVTTFYTIEPTT